MLANPWQFAPPVNADDEAYLITELGNIFPIENKTVTSAPSQSIGNIAYNLMIQGALMETLDFDGMVLHGDIATDAQREPLYSWVAINSNTKHAGVILDGTGTSIVIPRFYSTYDYTSGSTVSEISHNPPVQLLNVQGHKTVYGSVAETSITDGMEFSGTGWSIAKLGPVAGGSYRIQGEVPSGASVQFITSPNNMLSTYYDGSKYVLVDGGDLYPSITSSTQRWAFVEVEHHGSPVQYSWFRGNSSDRCNWTGHPGSRQSVCYGPDIDLTDIIRKIIWKTGKRQYDYGYMFYAPVYNDATLKTHLPVYVKDRTDISFVYHGDYCTEVYFSHDRYNCRIIAVNNKAIVINNLNYDIRVGSIDNPFGEVTGVGGIEIDISSGVSSYNGYNKITKVAITTDFEGCRRGCGNTFSDPISSGDRRNVTVNATGSVTIKDRQPYDAHQSYISDFTIDQQNPSNSYILVKPGGNTVTVKGVSQTTQSDVIFGLTSAPGDTYYSLAAGGNTIYGKTTPSGAIVLGAADFAVADYLAGGILTLYPNALKHYDTNFGMVGFDLVNDATFRFGNSNLIHIPEEFVKVRAWADVYVTDVTLAGSGGSVTLHYLSGQYDAGDTITLPNVPLYDSFRMTIDGQTTPAHELH